jgi:hypothetical protein
LVSYIKIRYRVFEKRAPRGIFGPNCKRDEVAGGWRQFIAMSFSVLELSQ